VRFALRVPKLRALYIQTRSILPKQSNLQTRNRPVRNQICFSLQTSRMVGIAPALYQEWGRRRPTRQPRKVEDEPFRCLEVMRRRRLSIDRLSFVWVQNLRAEKTGVGGYRSFVLSSATTSQAFAQMLMAVAGQVHSIFLAGATLQQQPTVSVVKSGANSHR
jgi:hypothetical protein